MHRRPIGRGRTLAIIGALVVLVACILPWFRVGGEEGNLTAVTSNAFEGIGILAFIAALATIALIALPYAAGDRPVGVDRALAYGLLAVVAAIGRSRSATTTSPTWIAACRRSPNRSGPRWAHA